MLQLAGVVLAAMLIALAVRLYLASQLPSLSESTLSVTSVLLGGLAELGGATLLGVARSLLGRRAAAGGPGGQP